MEPSLPGDEWQQQETKQQEQNPTRRDIIRFHKMQDRLILKLPWYSAPVDCEIAYVHAPGDLIQINMFNLGFQWAERTQVKVLGILSPIKKKSDPTTEPQQSCE